jgi:hypothetical protein
MVLGGGGEYYIAWYCGFFHGLYEAGLDTAQIPEMVVGTSAGSYVGSSLLSGEFYRLRKEFDFFGKFPEIFSQMAPLATPNISQMRADQINMSATDGSIETRKIIGAAALAADNKLNSNHIEKLAGLLTGDSKTNWPASRMFTTGIDCYSGERLVVGQQTAQKNNIALAHGTATPESFYDGVVANTPDPATGKPDPEKIAAYKASHPDAKALGEYLGKNNPIASYANSDFYSVHTFKFINKNNKITLVRWRFVPQDGVKRLGDEELKTAPTRFLDQDIMNKTQAGMVRWDMVLVIGDPMDEQTNPTIYWPVDCKEIKAGVLTLTSASTQQGGACEKINFDPLVMTSGIAPTNDPVLLFRSPAYANSYAKRLTGQ